MPMRWRFRESRLRHVLLCLACLVLLAPAPLAPGPAPGQAAGAGLPAGVRNELWRARFRDGLPNTVLVGDVLVVSDGDRFEGRDTATGHVSWTFDASKIDGYTPPEDRLAVVGDQVVAVAPHETPDESEDPRGDDLLVFDGRTGAVLWNLTSGFYGFDLPRPYLTYLGVSKGRVLIHLPALGLVRALDIVTGRRLWETAMPSGCAGRHGGAAERVVALLVTCGRRTRLEALDPGSGRLMWSREVFPQGTPLITVSGGTVGLGSDASFTVYDTGGRQLYDHMAGQPCGCELVATATGALIAWSANFTSSYSLVWEAVNRADGSVTRLSGQAGDLERVMAVNGRLYGVRRLGRDPLGSVVVTIDPANGRQTPVTGFPAFQEVTDVSEHLVIVNDTSDEDDALLVAYRTVPAPADDPGAGVRDGVGRERWPDACALLLPAALTAGLRGTRYRSVARSAPPELNLTTPTGCDLLPLDDEQPVLALSVLWVGRTPGEAETVLRVVAGFLDMKRTIVPGTGERVYVGRQMADFVLLRTGDTVIRLDGAGDRAAALRLAAGVASTLKAVA
ncbi:PQQ-binding-like beta-propeller repeat protein [Nonomuraea wenchangensis]|uniref:outer membrane protein assembly factor BamB family protein n=1 Tax=Nonomuraea wenchangensis TaxID=568860 RepID=UPI0033192643